MGDFRFMIKDIDYERLKKETFRDLPLPSDLKKNEIVVLYNNVTKKYEWLEYVEGSPVVLMFRDLEKLKIRGWMGSTRDSAYSWCRMDKIPTKKEIPSDPIESRSEILDL